MGETLAPTETTFDRWCRTLVEDRAWIGDPQCPRRAGVSHHGRVSTTGAPLVVGVFAAVMMAWTTRRPTAAERDSIYLQAKKALPVLATVAIRNRKTASRYATGSADRAEWVRLVLKSMTSSTISKCGLRALAEAGALHVSPAVIADARRFLGPRGYLEDGADFVDDRAMVRVFVNELLDDGLDASVFLFWWLRGRSVFEVAAAH